MQHSVASAKTDHNFHLYTVFLALIPCTNYGFDFWCFLTEIVWRMTIDEGLSFFYFVKLKPNNTVIIVQPT